MKAFLKVLSLTLGGAFVGASGASLYKLWLLQSRDVEFGHLPIDYLVVDVFQAHIWAIYGAGAILGIIIVERFIRFLLWSGRQVRHVMRYQPPTLNTKLDADDLIKARDRERAERYFQSKSNTTT